MKKICENCHKVIKKKEWHFQVDEHKDGKIVGTKYVHKECQDRFNAQMNQGNMQGLKLAAELMKKAEGMMQQIGFPEPIKTVVIK